MKISTFSTIFLLLFAIHINAQETSFRINAGGTEVEYNGETFIADTYSNTGNTLDRPQTGLPEPYQTFRFSRSQQMSYDIPLEDGEYTVNLYFAELWFGATGGGAGGVGNRVFDVNIEGQLAEDNLDVFAEVGADAMLMKSHTVTVSGGILNIDFDSRDAVGGERHPIINAIEIIDEQVPQDLAIEGFVVQRSPVGGDSGLSPYPLNNGDQIRFWENDQWIYLVGAETTNDVQSVLYEYTNASGATFSEIHSVSSDGVLPGVEVGMYSITATPYLEPDQGGVAGTPLTISYEILEQCSGVTIEVVDASTCEANDGYAIIRDEANNYFAFYGSELQLPVDYDNELEALIAHNLSKGNYNLDFYEEYGCMEALPFNIGADDCGELNDFALRINTGGTEVEYNGETFIADTYSNTGNTLDRPQTGLPEPYQTFRFSRSQQMSYDIPLEDGEYTVNLYFAELWFGATGGGSGGVGNRVFDVSIEGQLAEDNLDVFAEVGADAMLMKSHTVTVTGGVLNIDFDSRDAVGGERHPIINAIEILGEQEQQEIAIEAFSVYENWTGDLGAYFLEDGDQIRLVNNGHTYWGIGAYVTEHVQSVLYEYINEEGNPETKVLNQSRLDLIWIEPSATIGIHSITATPYSELDQGGEAGIPVTISYEILDQCSSVTIEVIDASTCTANDGYVVIKDEANNYFLSFDILPELSVVFDEELGAYVAGNLSPSIYTLNFHEEYDCEPLQIIIGSDEDCMDTSSFITTWKTDNQGFSEDNQITIPTVDGETYNYSVDWGDGSIDENVTGKITHTYANAGTYTVSIAGDFPRLQFFPNSGQETDYGKILTVNQWGDLEWNSMFSAFMGCTNLEVVATDVPNLSNVQSMSYMFSACYDLVGNSVFNDWNVSAVTDMSRMFDGAESFNQDISRWNVSKVATMEDMFSTARAFNRDLSTWNVSNVTDMSGMFRGAISFNQDISSWDVSNVTNMFEMFYAAEAFDQNIASWNVVKVTDMRWMFRDSKVFNQDLGNWNVSNVQQYKMHDIFTNSGLSNQNYDKTLIGWSQLPSLQNGVELDAPQNQYCASETARQKLINDYGWVINDAGKAADCPELSDFALRINTGGTEVEYNGETFIADTYSNTGSVLDRPQTGLPEPYQTFRFSRSQEMSYDIPLEDGEYTVNLYFAELWFGATGGGSGGVGSRVFDVSIEGQLAEDNLDVFAEVGADAMLMKSHTVTVTGGVLNIDFDSRDMVGGERHPVINAIEIMSIDDTNSVTSKSGITATTPNSNDASLSPNPVVESTTLSFEKPVQLSDIQVFDVSGRLVRTFKATEVSADGAYKLKVHGLESGTYFINAIDKQGVKHQKQMVIQQ